MHAKRLQIVCSACGIETFLKREPIYEGLRKTGEKLACADCGHVFADESDVSFKDSAQPQIFTDADRSAKIEIFTSDDAERNCRHCCHYIVNPFIQRCGIHHREVQATDCCRDFEPNPD